MSSIMIQKAAGQHTFTGRQGWPLRNPVNAGVKGVTTVDNPAPRRSAYVHKLPKAGYTDLEEHKGEFAGKHGRYRLLTPVVVLLCKKGSK
jgi:hypothetical protein